jgi:hypothetical protein
MEMKIQARYDNGINSSKDQAAFAIAKKFNANFIGSGCWLHEPFERDLEWSALGEYARSMAGELRKAGFKVTL